MRQHILPKSSRHMRNRFRRRSLVRAAAYSATLVVASGLALVAVQRHALAFATAERDVLLSSDGGMTFFADDPFTGDIDEGIPRDGNALDENRDMFDQVEFEGLVDMMGTAMTDDDDNVNFDIYVGRTSSGSLVIDSGTELRDMNLIIGDVGELPNMQLRRGFGEVRIDNALYNNDPSILPYPYSLTGMSPSKHPREDEDGATTGFDVYVGRGGTGKLQITMGGIAEIQDAVIVGDQSQAVGTLLVDGADSYLGSGGFEFMSGDDEFHYMIIGRLGSGTMQITNGGTVYTVGAREMGGAGIPVFGAVIGSSFAAETNDAPALGGQGYVNVDGLQSTWTVGGSLQVGGFHDSCEGGMDMCDPDMEDLEGDEVLYSGNVGSGTLNVSNGALVSIVTPPIDEDASDVPPKLDLLIGITGRVVLAGGRIELLGAFPVDPEEPTEIPVQRLERGRVINDGQISGHGDITTLQFRNRMLGEMLVGAGEKMTITALGDFDPDASDPPDEYPGSNYGLVQVIGTDQAKAEFEFRRPIANPDPDFDEQPFLNLPLPINTMEDELEIKRGRIHVQNGIIRFRTDILNFGDVFFTGGSNIVSGEFDNAPGGVISISGDHTTVAFDNELTNDGDLIISPNVSQVTVGQFFEMGALGALSLAVGGQPESQSVSHLLANGDILLDGLLEVSLFATSTPFSPQPGDTFEIMRAGGELLGDFAAFSLPFFSSGVGLFAFPDYGLDAYFVTALAIPGAGDADLNGDGVVDDTDLDIWRQNLGNPGGLGDINGDGIVDGLDYFEWLAQTTAPGAPAGGGAGAPFNSSVPEPASGALLAVGGLVALAWRRRRPLGI